ncbi:MAG: DUF983 domain-containing protein [Pseudomonadota bacterium]
MSDLLNLPFWRIALFGLCPRCGAKTLFAAPARIAAKCGPCGLELAQLERGARAAGLVTIIVAILLITAAMLIESAFRPPILLQLLVWAPLTVVVVLGTLRGFKAYMLMVNYERQNARAGDDE